MRRGHFGSQARERSEAVVHEGFVQIQYMATRVRLNCLQVKHGCFAQGFPCASGQKSGEEFDRHDPKVAGTARRHVLRCFPFWEP